jgi:uncharacterized protein
MLRIWKVSDLKILLIADDESSFIWDYFNPDVFKDIDLMISCGDLKAEYLSFLVTMIKAPLYYVPGNHDTRFLTSPPEGCVSIDGKFVKYKGVRILGLGGSYAYNNKPYQYTEAQMSRRVRKLLPKIWLNKGFDILVSHAPAYQICDGSDLCHRGFQCFARLIEKYSPRYFIHGHQHMNYGRQPRIFKHKNTTVINAYGYYILEY